MVHEYVFECPLPNGLHARPASHLADMAARFAADITLCNERTGACGNAKSVLAMVATDLKRGDACRVRISGVDAGPAHAALRDFLTHVLPGCDEPLPAADPGAAAPPRALRNSGLRWFAGVAASPGIGRGVVAVAGGLALPEAFAHRLPAAPEVEAQQLDTAVTAVCAELRARLAARPDAVEAAILSAHLSLAQDVALLERIRDLIAGGASAARAIVDAAHYFAQHLEAAESAYIRERAVDVADIAQQLLEQICGAGVRPACPALTGPTVLVAENLTPRQLLMLDRRHLRGLVLEHGGPTSHTLILARSFGIPALTGVEHVRANLPAGRVVIVDGQRGAVVTELTPQVRRYYARQLRALRRRRAGLARYRRGRGCTHDGRTLEIGANVSSAAEVEAVVAQGADGIGLFRTEMLYMEREAPPSEAEQAALYAQAARAAGGRPVIIRTLDVGGDKPVPYVRLPQERNPFLGRRGVRVYGHAPELLRAQLRAIARASAHGPLWLMAPMISTVEEMRAVRGELRRILAELRAIGVPCNPHMPVGMMLEVPSAAFAIADLAREADFFSIGTNDLAQYFLAVDRDSETVADLYSPLHPAFLRLLAMIVAEAHAQQRWVGLCGEMARAPEHLPLLVGLGVDELSVAGPEIPRLKAALARLSAGACRGLVRQVLECPTRAAVEATLAAAGGRAAAAPLLEAELVLVDSRSGSKEEVIEELVSALFAAGRTDAPQLVEDAIWVREGVYPTGLGHGFAVPHCKSDAMRADSIGVARLAAPIAWDGSAGEPVQCVILLALRDAAAGDVHMNVLSKLARRLMDADFRTRLLAAPHRAALQQCLAEELGGAAAPAGRPVLLTKEQ